LALSAFVLIGGLLAGIGAFLIILGLVSLLRRRPFRFVLRTVTGFLLVSLGGLSGAIGIGMTGYRALTREEVAARIEVQPVGTQRFSATVVVPDHPAKAYEVGGDAIYVDAHILKWKPIVNLLGLHTAYELDRISGRYDDLEQERSAVRTVYSLAEDKPANLFDLRRRYAMLAPLFDAEYGSGTFIPVTRPATFEVLVSTTGLLIREVTPESKP
jgi:hypothetical protein